MQRRFGLHLCAQTLSVIMGLAERRVMGGTCMPAGADRAQSKGFGGKCCQRPCGFGPGCALGVELLNSAFLGRGAERHARAAASQAAPWWQRARLRQVRAQRRCAVAGCNRLLPSPLIFTFPGDIMKPPLLSGAAVVCFCPAGTPSAGNAWLHMRAGVRRRQGGACFKRALVHEQLPYAA